MKMVTRTFRMNPEYDKILNNEAAKHGLSVSALLNQIIRQYVLMTRFTEKVPAITIQYKTFEPLLTHIDDDDIIKEAEMAGSILPEEAILQRGQKLNHETISWLIENVYGRYGNWFESTKSEVNGHERIHLAHQMNHKWSTYLGSYMTSMYNSILDVNPKIETRANSVTIYLGKGLPNGQLFKKARR
jgi:hypothetical protein